LVYFGESTIPVAGVSKVSALKRTSTVIPYKEGGNAITSKGLGRTEYEPVTLERGVTHSSDFEDWANASQELVKGQPRTSLANLRKPVVRIELLNEAGQTVKTVKLYNCWVSEFQVMSDLNAGGTGILIEHIKIEHEGWETDLTQTEPKEI
jgi:phage tail-like protein